MATPTTDLGFQNFFSTTLSSGINASDTSIPLDTVPNADEGFLVIDPDSSTSREVIFYSSKTGSTVECTSAADGRGQDDTSASAHSSGTTVIMAPVAGFFEALQSGAAIADGAIDNANLSTTAGDLGGAWVAYTPSFTGFTLGNGTLSAKWTKVGKTVKFRGKVVLGTTSSFAGTTTAVYVSFPSTSVSAEYMPSMTSIGTVGCLDVSTSGTFPGTLLWATTTTGQLANFTMPGGTYLQNNRTDSNDPFTWTTGDTFTWHGEYEEA